MALFASFGQPQSFTENSFLPSCDNPEVFCEVNQPGLNYFNSHVMKRKRVSFKTFMYIERYIDAQNFIHGFPHVSIYEVLCI